MKSIHNFVIKIQNSDESTKKFWVMLCSILSMLFVVALWSSYINLSIAKVPGPSTAGLASAQGQQIAKDGNEVETPGFFAIFGAGTKIIFDALKAKLSVKHDIVISNQEINFLAEDLEPIKGAGLP